ncbi:MAG: sulfatase, partial [bacterium]|nr:sulfatase [bacterium]
AGGAAIALGSVTAPRHVRAAADRPNIIFILADDLGWAELGSYGNTFNETPNLDQLAAHGMRFTQAYAAAPVCSPTRASFLTGQYPARVGITNYLRAEDPNHLSPEKHTTIAKVLRGEGYATGVIGKWHLMGDYATRKGDPKLHGFQEVMCLESSYIGGGDYFHPYKHLESVPARWEGEYLTDRLGTEAADFIDRHADDPFFLYLSFYSVHTALKGKPDLVEKYKAKPGAGKNRNNPALAAMIETIDDAVGLVTAALDRNGVENNTVLVFMSDNGGEHKVTSNAPLRGAKSQLYEGGIREPLLVRWPGRVSAGTVCDAPVCTVDFFPTFVEATGAKSPEGQTQDGESLVPLLTQSGAPSRDTLYWHYPLDKPHFLGGRSSGAIRKGDMKLIEFYDTGAVELYDLAEDIGEATDLAAKQPDTVKALRADLDAWRKRVGAVM